MGRTKWEGRSEKNMALNYSHFWLL
jgi:hypothetical protein